MTTRSTNLVGKGEGVSKLTPLTPVSRPADRRPREHLSGQPVRRTNLPDETITAARGPPDARLGPFQASRAGPQGRHAAWWSERKGASAPDSRDWVSGVFWALSLTSAWRTVPIGRWRRKAISSLSCAMMEGRPAVSDSDDVAVLQRWPHWRSLYDLGTNPWGGTITVGYDVSFDAVRALLNAPRWFHL
jgi:hypothetical protein